MPVGFRQDGVRFLFYANEGNPREPMHVHMLRDGIDAKVLRELTEIIEGRRDEIARAWDEFFGEG